jgi:hypothetical protein
MIRRAQIVVTAYISVALGAPSALAAGPKTATTTTKTERVREQWVAIRAAYRRYPWQRSTGTVVKPKLSAPELRQLRRIAKMPRISVWGDRIVGANDAYYESARRGVPLPASRMVSLELKADGKPFSRTVRGGVTKLREPWGDSGKIAEVIQFVAPRDKPVTSSRLIKAGVYRGAKVSIRRIGSGFNASMGISITPPGRVGPVGADLDSYTLLPPRLTPNEQKLAPLLGAFIKENAARLGLTPTAAHHAAAAALRKSIGFPGMLAK